MVQTYGAFGDSFRGKIFLDLLRWKKYFILLIGIKKETQIPKLLIYFDFSGFISFKLK